MKVVVTGATGNVGTSTVQALSESQEIDEIIGLARREPTWAVPKTSWVEADVLTSDLGTIFDGVDAVIHLAWAIQPSRDAVTLERINVEGSRRVFEAVAAAGVPKLVHASSVGAYSRGPKDREVDEDWPTEGTPTSFYSRHKVAVERELDRFEAGNPETRVVRLRPALIFKDEAATEIRRLFVGPFLPNFLLRRGLLPALPRVERLRFQAVHSEDVGRAYLRAVLADVDGAFNIAAEPPLSPEEMAERIGVRSFPVPARGCAAPRRSELEDASAADAAGLARHGAKRAADVLRPRARGAWLGAPPQWGRCSGGLLAGMRGGHGAKTPPLEADSAGARFDDLKLSETDDEGRPVAYNRIAGVVVTGNEDGAHHVISEVSGALLDVGFTVPGQAWTYWNRGPGPGDSYLESEAGREWSHSTGRAAAANMLAVARALESMPIPAPPSE